MRWRVCGHDGSMRHQPAARCAGLLAGTRGHRYGDLALGVTLADVGERLGSVAQRVGPVHYRRHLAGLDQVLEDSKVLVIGLHEEVPELLAPEPEDHSPAHEATRAREP